MKKKQDGTDAKTETESGQGEFQPGDAAAEGTTEIPSADRATAELRQERDRLEAQLQRTLADLSNLRKRHQKELEDSRHRALEGFSQELLPVVDNFYLALEAHRQHEQGGAQEHEARALVDGVKMVKSLLQGVLERHGVVEIPSHGKTFDPNRHEAVGLAPTDEVEPGKVYQVLQRGYMLGERVIRPSRVLVSSEKPAERPSEKPKERT